MLWDHTAWCRRCRKRVYVQPRYYSSADDVFLRVVTLGGYACLKWLFPARFGRWQCDECGSLRCVAARRVRAAKGRRRRRRAR